jgi:hypothetical protein
MGGTRSALMVASSDGSRLVCGAAARTGGLRQAANSPIVSVGRYAWGFDRASHGQVRTRLDARAVVGELTAVCAAKSQPTEFLGDSWGVAVLTEAELWPILPPRCLLASENAHSAPGFGASRMSFSGDVGIPGVSRNCEVGFFINFNVARLVDGVRRVV